MNWFKVVELTRKLSFFDFCRVQNLFVDHDHLQDVLNDQDLALDVLDDQDLVKDDLLLGQDDHEHERFLEGMTGPCPDWVGIFWPLRRRGTS